MHKQNLKMFSLKTGRLVVIPNARHAPHLDQPAAFHAALFAFLARFQPA